MISVEDPDMEGDGPALKNRIWDVAKPIVETWTGMELKPTSQYGIRVYTEGAILNPHADRCKSFMYSLTSFWLVISLTCVLLLLFSVPLVSSCIVNVAQEVDEDWLLEVYDREGNAVNVTMEPGVCHT
jgi:prolyl 4-hydroxylase